MFWSNQKRKSSKNEIFLNIFKEPLFLPWRRPTPDGNHSLLCFFFFLLFCCCCIAWNSILPNKFHWWFWYFYQKLIWRFWGGREWINIFHITPMCYWDSFSHFFILPTTSQFHPISPSFFSHSIFLFIH